MPRFVRCGAPPANGPCPMCLFGSNTMRRLSVWRSILFGRGIRARACLRSVGAPRRLCRNNQPRRPRTGAEAIAARLNARLPPGQATPESPAGIRIAIYRVRSRRPTRGGISWRGPTSLAGDHPAGSAWSAISSSRGTRSTALRRRPSTARRFSLPPAFRGGCRGRSAAASVPLSLQSVLPEM